jgi:probable F420-dependent oxidoreductase
MKFWQSLTWIETDQLVEAARFAEEVGFDGVMLADHGVFPREIRSAYPYASDGSPPMNPDAHYPDCWATLGALAAATKQLRFSIAIYVLPLRNVFEVARATGTIAILSGNRFALGAGVGWMKEEFDVYGVDFKTRGRRTDEMIEVLRKLWRGGMVEHRGRHFEFPALQIAPAPSQTVPIWWGGASEAALRRTARLCDGWIGAGNLPDEVPPILSRLAALRAEAGRSQLPFETVVGLKTPPDVDTFKGLGDQGMTTGLAYPFKFALGDRSTLDAKKRLMEDFAEKIIRPCR